MALSAHHVSQAPYDARLVRMATYASVTVAVILIAAKAMAWLVTHSVSLQATLIDSLLDAAASVVNLLAVRRALMPPTHHYRFGYGKVEAIAALAQSLFIAGSAGWLITEASLRFIEPVEIHQTNAGIAVMFLAMILTFGLIYFQNIVIKKTNSPAIRADSIHYRSDFLINGGVLLVFIVSNWFNILWFDPLCGLFISLYILYTAWTITKEAFSILLDRELAEHIRKKIKNIAISHPKVKGLHELRTRSSGWKSFIQLHIVLDENIVLKDAHVIGDEVEAMILTAFPNSEVLIHTDPTGISEDHTVKMPKE